MLSGWLLLLLAVNTLLHALNALRPRKGRLLLIPSFFASWLTIELALHWAVLVTVITGVLVAQGALDHTVGIIGLVLAALGVVGLLILAFVSRRTVLIMGGATEDLELEPDPEPEAKPFPRSHVVLPFLMHRRKGTRMIKNIEFRRIAGKVLKLDVTLPSDAKPGDRRPVMLQVHGGGWVIGDKREQGIPLLRHLAANGWVGVNANYRLSPMATFPDHLIDLKAAIAWIREHADELGGDPDYICVTGGSAGGHLAALVGLTANDPEYQPGFEHVDTTMRAAVPIYGVYDWTNRLGTWTDEAITRFFQPIIVKRFFDTEREEFEKASPIDRVRPDAPPFFVVHGDRDTLAPVEDARFFVERMREVSQQPVLYAEMQGAQHAFEIFPSYRAARVIEALERVLTTLWHEHRRGEEASEPELAAAVSD
jgi:acetyl esterase/lipase